MYFSKKKMFIIAEIGLNHNGKYVLAKKLIKKAKLAGADAVKIQTYETIDLYNEKFSSKKIINYMKKLELKKYEVKNLKKFCNKIKIEFFSTPFDIKSAIFLNSIRINKFKIASSNIRNINLLEKIKSFKKEIIISSGYADIKSLKKICKSFNKKKLSVLYCVSLYPAPIEKVDLSQIIKIKKTIKAKKVGFSDHTKGIYSAIASKFYGAEILEKHIKLSEKQKCPDQEVSVSPKKFYEMVQSIRSFEQKKKKVSPHLMRGEIGIYLNKNRFKGQKISLKDLDFKRPSTKFPNNELEKFSNKILKTDIKKGTPLNVNFF